MKMDVVGEQSVGIEEDAIGLQRCRELIEESQVV